MRLLSSCLPAVYVSEPPERLPELLLILYVSSRGPQSAPSGWRRLESEGVVEAGLLTRQWDDLTSSTVTLGVLQRLGLVCPLAPPPPLYGQTTATGEADARGGPVTYVFPLGSLMH